ncbi:superoxide dismutase [Cu-Zn]-like [Orbicella faveolata]|uniref:superoxide dismutase [Cu-Zn]-like n=1 Tax=Orbicella faveolata TaxID=48498 RepID=UPI0009E4C4ED|nr:superoxide dismutase [Cu-Zn]-like [Orbicella faveolata]
MLLLVFGLMMLATATATEVCEDELAVRRTVTAISFIIPNSAPPDDTETPVAGKVVLMQPGYRRMHIKKKPRCHTRFFVNISGLPPDTIHGFHIHEFGDIVSDGCQSTGGHYNPFNRSHGGPFARSKDGNVQDNLIFLVCSHVGDLGNVRADRNGVVNVVFQDPVGLVYLSGPNSVIGRAFVIHQKEDDLGRGTGEAEAGSLKTGNAGARLGCGVIARAPLSVLPNV